MIIDSSLDDFSNSCNDSGSVSSGISSGVGSGINSGVGLGIGSGVSSGINSGVGSGISCANMANGTNKINAIAIIITGFKVVSCSHPTILVNNVNETKTILGKIT